MENELTFSECLPAALFMIFSGGAAAALCCMISGSITKKGCRSYRFTEFCLLLSAAAGCATWALFSAQGYVVSFFSHPVSDYVYFACLFACGALCVLYWKVVLPLVCVLYICVSAYTGFFLYSVFGTAENKFSIMVNSDSLSVNEQSFRVDSQKEKKLEFSAFTLPPKLLVPFPKTWCRLVRVNEAEASAAGETGEFGSDFNFFKKWLLSDEKKAFLELPDTDIYPAVYNVILEKNEGSDPECVLQKTF